LPHLQWDPTTNSYSQPKDISRAYAIDIANILLTFTLVVGGITVNGGSVTINVSLDTFVQ